MIVMKDQSRDVIDTITGDDGAACDLHGRHWTGIPVAAHDDTGDVAVLQYVHPDFERVTESHIIDFADEKTCCECGDATAPLPLWVAERILRACPNLVLEPGRWEGICRACAHKAGCPICREEENHDSDEDVDGWQSHPYLH